jgi:lysophospholipase L1-like esterase
MKAPTRRAPRSLRAAVLVALVAAACTSGTESSSSTSTSSAQAALANVTAVTALGDSVPSGYACNCTPYPKLTASDVASANGKNVDAYNDAGDGYTTKDVIGQLRRDRSVIDDVHKAGAILVEIGANDIAYSDTCTTNVSCYQPDLSQAETNISSIVSRIHQIDGRRHVAVFLLDYWSVWLGGQYATAQGPAYVDAAASLTTSLGEAIRSIAGSTGSTYVNLQTAFKGPNEDWDETHLLASDGDHPNAEGHERIAAAIAYTVLKG